MAALNSASLPINTGKYSGNEAEIISPSFKAINSASVRLMLLNWLVSVTGNFLTKCSSCLSDSETFFSTAFSFLVFMVSISLSICGASIKMLNPLLL